MIRICEGDGELGRLAEHKRRVNAFYKCIQLKVDITFYDTSIYPEGHLIRQSIAQCCPG